TVCVVGKMRDLILQLSKSSIYSTKPGDDHPQVMAYGLEEEVDYYAPPFRFASEGDNPWIPWRQMSETPLPDADQLEERLLKEKEDAIAQLHYVKETLQRIKDEALTALAH
ncbi:hypothetical protein RZP58_22535, partial [Klebsiella quasipneumoniae subsp. similipneumoniae]|nr:hypothetical protein [Klebsiella quasipneumoniae subsp. similipneumoniae]